MFGIQQLVLNGDSFIPPKSLETESHVQKNSNGLVGSVQFLRMVELQLYFSMELSVQRSCTLNGNKACCWRRNYRHECSELQQVIRRKQDRFFARCLTAAAELPD